MATEQQGGTQDNATQDTTLSGDAKGETQTIESKDVGNAADVLGATGATGTPGDNGVEKAVPEGTASETPPVDDQAAKDAAAAEQQQKDADAAQAAAEAAAAAAKAQSVTAQVRKTIPAPTAQQTGVKDASKTTATTPAAAVVTKQVAAASVTNTASAAPASDRDLPEVVAAMKVAKAQTQSALYQVIQYASDLHPGKRVDAKTIESAQVNLRSNLFTILSAEDVNFKVVYQALLAIVRTHKNNCFAITARNRGLNTISLATLDNKGMRFLTKIVDLLVLTAGTNNLEQVKAHYDFSKLAEWCPNVRIQQNLTSYYS